MISVVVPLLNEEHSLETLYDEIARGRLRVVRFGKSVRIPADELRAYVDRAKAEAGLQPVA